MQVDESRLDTEAALAEYIAQIRADWYEHKYLIASYRTGKQRTLTQNNALHLFCQMLADQLNASGLDMRKVMKPEVEIPWDMNSVKRCLWKPLQQAMLNKESTTEADRIEYSLVHEVLGRHLAKTQGINIPEWPKKKEN
jgi:hypothetical protein